MCSLQAFFQSKVELIEMEKLGRGEKPIAPSPPLPINTRHSLKEPQSWLSQPCSWLLFLGMRSSQACVLRGNQEVKSYPQENRPRQGSHPLCPPHLRSMALTRSLVPFASPYPTLWCREWSEKGRLAMRSGLGLEGARSPASGTDTSNVCCERGEARTLTEQCAAKCSTGGA